MTSAVEWNAETAHVLTFYKYFLGILGLWVLDEENIFSRIRWLMSTIIELSTTISFSLEVIRHCRGHEDALDAFLSASTSVTSISKLLLHRVNWRYKLILVESIINDWTFVENLHSRDIMRKYARIGRLGSLVFFYFGCASFVFLFSPFIFAKFNLLWTSEEHIYNKTGERRLLLAAYCVFGSYTVFAHGFIEVLQTLQLLVNCISQCGNDGFFFNLTMHVCGQFEVLRVDFSRIDSKKLLSCNRLGILLKRHYRLIYLAHHLQKAFSLVILSQLLMSVILLCVEGFQLILTLSMHNTYAAMKHLLFIVALLIQLFLYCFAGQTLEFQSQGLASAIYNSSWYSFDVSVMKSLPLMILRAAHPHQLSAGKFLSPMASERWKDDVAYAITPFKLVAWSIGVWPLQVHNVYSLIPYALGFCCATFVFIVPSVEFYLGCTDAVTNVDCLMLVCCGILGMLKTVWFRIYAKSLANNYNSVMKDYLTIENAKERVIMRKHTFMGRMLCCLILSFSHFSCVMYGLIAILDENKHVNITNEDTMLEYPIPSKCVMKYLNAPVSMHKIFCLVDTIVLILASTANHGNDALFLNVTLHICGQVKILKANFLDFDVKGPHIYDRFNVLVKRHKYLIKLARELSEMISFVLLIELFIISILLCIMGFQLILQLGEHNIVLIIKNIMVQNTFLIQLTLYGVIGNYLKSEMEEIGLSIYQSTWYNFPAKLTRHLIFIIMRSDSPVTLQAGNFIVINLATYVSILKASFSYLSVLRVMVKV